MPLHVTSKVDTYNALLFGAPKQELQKLQRVSNAAARLLAHTKKFDHINPVFQQLHWLAIQKHVHFKIQVLSFKGLDGLAQSYITDVLQPYVRSRVLIPLNPPLLKPLQYNLKTYGLP